MRLLKEMENLNMTKENELLSFFCSFGALFFDTKYMSPLTGISLSSLVDANFEPINDIHGSVEITPRDSLSKKKINAGGFRYLCGSQSP